MAIPVETMASRWAAEKAQALIDLEHKFNLQTAMILSCYDLPKHIRLDLHMQHRNNYKVPDDLRLKFINSAFEGDAGILDHPEQLKIHSRKEAEKFWIENAAATKKAQALEDMQETYKKKLLKYALDLEDFPEHIKENYIRKCKVDDDELGFRNLVEERFGVGNHDKQLRIQAWEEFQWFLINTMDDKLAANKVHAFQEIQERYVQGIMNRFDRVDIPDYLQQDWKLQEHKIPDEIRLGFINDIENKFSVSDDEEEPKEGYISEDYNKLKAQALHDLEEKFNQQTTRILKLFSIPEHIRLDLQEQH
uniref:Uncharacterized protein n=1 Tax=Leersia perrieri TaxID=77586 RepID=A0A0D9WJY2_9ORYZ